ncbi:VOC family protein [Spongiactinospora sp. TRM90649]|uniref:VOC family protein n=1 Tax=Spongiactinospora sp. TRM90649 TaxID=3031114 RepID=UPI0023F84E8D|nr:VOC family protein [Spongiactinospora sp. TRM90649]MDF5757219.1 VOC family protein [Spongiactinospora sp. TRM90649]
MARGFQVTFDCSDPDRMARFWAEALHYRLEEPPDGFATWAAYWADRGLDEEIPDGYDAIVDPEGVGPSIWFQKVPEAKVVKNRLHLDVRLTEGRSVPVEIRRERIDAEADRLTGLGATLVSVVPDGGMADYYAVTMRDPEGNEFCLS